MSASGAEGKMERYPMALADEALDVAFQAGALKRCSKQPHVIVRMNDRSAKRKANRTIIFLSSLPGTFPRLRPCRSQPFSAAPGKIHSLV
jgi:hypothetical protein